MAAETEDQKPGDDGDRRAGRDRRRPPLTIDLTAASVTGKGASPASEPPIETEASAAPPPRSRDSSIWPGLAGLLPKHVDRETWIGYGGAAVLGAVVALIMLTLLQTAGVLPTPGGTAAREAAAQAKAASDAIAGVDRRLTAVEAMTEGLPALRTDLTAASTRVAALEQVEAGAPTKADVDGLRSDLTATKIRLDQAAAPATAADLTALSARVQRVEATLSTSGAAAPAPAAAGPPDADTADLNAKIAMLASRLDADEATIKSLSSASTAASTTAARTTALSAVRDAVEAGMPFQTQLDVLAALGPDPLIAGLRPYATTGIASRDTLIAEFPKVSDAILAATAGAGNSSILGKIAAGARDLVSVRPAGPIAGSDPPAIVSRMAADVAMGDLVTALGERDALPGAGKDASSDWAMQTAARVKADMLLAGPVATGATGNG